MSRPRSHRRAFTLIEVLVVVAIIGLLIAILVPVLSRSREQARRTVCASNQHQVLTSLFMYAQKYKGEMPHSVPDMNASLTWVAWQNFSKPPWPRGWVHLGLLYSTRQLVDPRVLFCPSHREFPHVYPEGWKTFSAGGGIERKATSYLYRLNGQVDSYKKGVQLTAKLDKFKVRDALFTCVFQGNRSKSQKERVWPHLAGVNAAYADGSVQLFNLSPALGTTAIKLYATSDIDRKDYFTYCMFRLLSGEREWIKPFLNQSP